MALAPELVIPSSLTHRTNASCQNLPSTFIKLPSYFRLPRGRFLRLWIENIQRAIGRTPPASSRLCSEHFDTSQFVASGEMNGRRLLKADAIPTIFEMVN